MLFLQMYIFLRLEAAIIDEKMQMCIFMPSNALNPHHIGLKACTNAGFDLISGNNELKTCTFAGIFLSHIRFTLSNVMLVNCQSL